MKVSVVILNWNGCDMPNFPYRPSSGIRKEDLRSVADNGSTDALATLLQQEFPSVRTIVLDQNYGLRMDII